MNQNSCILFVIDYNYTKDGRKHEQIYCFVCFRKGCHIKGRTILNPLTPNDHYSGRIPPLTSKRFFFSIGAAAQRGPWPPHSRGF